MVQALKRIDIKTNNYSTVKGKAEKYPSSRKRLQGGGFRADWMIWRQTRAGRLLYTKEQLVKGYGIGFLVR